MNKTYYSVNNWLVDIPSGSILHLTTGERKRLGEYQLKLLEVFIQNAGIILTREELTHLVWERRVIGNNSLPNAIHALRSALEDDGKQQRIIKTIPKKGYLLESGYCCSVVKEEAEVSDGGELITPDFAASTIVEASVESEAAEPADENVILVPSTAPDIIESPMAFETPVSGHVPARRYHRLCFAFVGVVLTAIISCGGMWYYLQGQQNRLIAQEHENSVYSNIHLYEISTASNPNRGKDNLYGKLKDTLYQLNQMLKSQSISMNVYYQALDQTLNYTFSLKNKCDDRQLAMTIYQWRIDPMQLNNLILRETKRKLNEMAICSSD